MINGMVFAQFFSLYEVIGQWEQSGVFDFLLPVLLIFAVVFGVLSSTNVLGSNRGVHVIIAGVVALLAMRTPFVSAFFSVIFPNLAVGIAILLVALILAGLFAAKGHNFGLFLDLFFYAAIGGAVIIGLVTFNNFGWFGSYWWQANWLNVVILASIVGVIYAMVNPSSGSEGISAQRAGTSASLTPLRGNN